MVDEKLKNFELYFVVETVKSDVREYRQDSDYLAPESTLRICVLLPRDREYVYNLAEISEKELASTPPDPILTPKGFAYVKKALEAAFVEPKVSVPETEDWGNSVDTEKKLNPGKAKSEWDNEPSWEEEKDNKNKPEVETWDNEKETWE